MFTKKQAQALSKRLDRIANHVEENYEVLGLDREAAYNFCLDLDHTADAIEQAAGLDRREALTLEREQDEPYMDSFNSPKGPIQTEPDEPYMDHYKDDTDSQVVQEGDLAPMSDGNWEPKESNWYDDGEDWDTNWF